MKIYHKSNFAIGLLLLGLGFANLFFAWQEGHTSLGHTWHIIFFCFLLGGGIVIRSLILSDDLRRQHHRARRTHPFYRPQIPQQILELNAKPLPGLDAFLLLSC